MKAKVVKHGSNSGCYYIKEIDNNNLLNNDEINVVKLDDEKIETKVDFIKIDTEGSELFVLKGAIELIKKQTINSN